MRRKNISVTTLASLLLVLTGAMFLAGCFPSHSGGEIALPVVTLSPVSGSVQTGAQLQFTATVVSPTSTTLSWSVNNILGGNSMLGTISAAGLYTAPTAIPSPAAVTIKATSSAEGSPSGAAIVTITAPVNSQVAVAPTDSSTPTGTTVLFSATVTGTINTAVTWFVDGVAGGNSTVGNISSAGLYTAPKTAPNPATVVVTATSQADTSQFASTTLTVTASNSVPLFVNFGLAGNTGNLNTTYYDGLFTTVTICLPSTIDCQIIPNILVDTGSVGLRVLNSALTTVPAADLTSIRDSSGNQVHECVQFGNTSYTWGPILFADVAMGGELASSVPIQVIGDTTYVVPESTCLTLGPGPSLDTVAALGANGILGVGTTIQDCGLNCAGGLTFPAYPYYVCPNSACQRAPVPVEQQVSNPVAYFNKDNNGVEITLPAISPVGAPSLPYTSADGSFLVPAGLLTFGVGTESNNGLGNATLYALDGNGNFPKIVFNDFTYTSDGFLDSGSNALYVSDPLGLGIKDCTNNPFYCPEAPLALSLTTYGANGTSGPVTLSIDNADSLFSGCPDCAAFSNLGGESGLGLSTDYFDLGLPFFFGRSVFVGIAGTAVPNKISAPNGYFAF